jgi:hypothetical protein
LQSLAKHLQDLAEGIVNIAMLPTLKVLGPHHHDKMCCAIEFPAHVPRGYKNLYRAIVVEVLDYALITLTESLMVVAHAV